MSSPIQKVALCSATGKFGPILLQKLIAEGFDVTVISRASSKASFPPEQKVINVSDECREDELVSAFKGQDAVVLSLSFPQLSTSKKFSQASIKAGCRWTILSTYGPNLEDPKTLLFPASAPHRQAVEDAIELEKQTQGKWAWTSISCGPWTETAIAAGAWKINGHTKTATVVDGGDHTFTSSTRSQVALAAARVLKRQPASARNKMIYVSSFEATMSEWVDVHKSIVGSEGWTVNNITAAEVEEGSQRFLKEGKFLQGYMDASLLISTAAGYQNRHSTFTTVANKELGLPEEDMKQSVTEALAMPSPFAGKR